MTELQAQKFGDLYTSGNGENAKAVCYNLEQLDFIDAVVRVNKVSDVGISLTLATVLTHDYETKVSKAGQGKGQTPIKKEKGEILIVEINSSIKDDRKPDEVNGRCQTLVNAFRGVAKVGEKVIQLHDQPVADGSIILLTFSGGEVPLKGLKASTLKTYMEDKEDSPLYIDRVNTDDADELILYGPLLDALAGSTYVEKQEYSKGKSYEQLFLERLDFGIKLVTDPDGKIIMQLAKLTGSAVDWNDDTKVWEYAETESINSVILGMLRV